MEPLVGYGEGEVKPKGVFTANLCIDGVNARVKVHVVPDNRQATLLLVGHPYTEQSDIVIICR